MQNMLNIPKQTHMLVVVVMLVLVAYRIVGIILADCAPVGQNVLL
jgi:hypothetical protein